MSQHLKRKYDASYRKRKREEQQLPGESTAAPADNAERSGRYRQSIAERSAVADDSGENFLDEPGPSWLLKSTKTEKRRQDGSTVGQVSDTAERMRRYRKRKREEDERGLPDEPAGEEDPPGESTVAQVSDVAERMRRYRKRKRDGQGIANNRVDSGPCAPSTNPHEQKGKWCAMYSHLKIKFIEQLHITIT